MLNFEANISSTLISLWLITSYYITFIYLFFFGGGLYKYENISVWGVNALTWKGLGFLLL